ncbi:MAG: ABC transporter ATP-binding protein [Azoarcus sp.]|jgi:iron(III) transport system ATP-binding protein|nr:ABC transporter ATP-binding protein [Azoarcus sp.]
MAKVSIERLHKRFHAGQDCARAIDGLDLTIAPGEFFVLLGPSGCGKTSTLRCLAGLDKPDAGRIRIGDHTVADPEAALFVPPHRRDIGMVFQSYALWPHMTVFNNVAYPLKARGKALTRGELARLANQALELVDLRGLGERYPHELSGGQQQRIALARALVASPQLVLFDEPLSNLDAQLRIYLRRELRAIHGKTGCTALYVTHDQTEALVLADRIGVMKAGRLEQLGSPEDVHERPATKSVALFLGFDNFVRGTVVECASPYLGVDIGLGFPLYARAHAALAVGDPVEIAVRASSLLATPVSRGQTSHALSLQIQDVDYHGERYEVAANCGSLALRISLLARDWGGRAAFPPPSGEIHVDFPPDKLVALPVHPMESDS